jgi:curli production assembly/transport component CsgG
MVYPIERENIGNLLQERNLIRSTRIHRCEILMCHNNTFTLCGSFIRGWHYIVWYYYYCGGGARYFGTGGSVKYRQDRVTIYLRMKSTANGKILKSVYISKQYYRKPSIKAFKYVNFKRLLR